eukprot:15839-Hanusia_phi.AAC.2
MCLKLEGTVSDQADSCQSLFVSLLCPPLLLLLLPFAPVSDSSASNTCRKHERRPQQHKATHISERGVVASQVAPLLRLPLKGSKGGKKEGTEGGTTRARE